jgi:hypothetical protein
VKRSTRKNENNKKSKNNNKERRKKQSLQKNKFLIPKLGLEVFIVVCFFFVVFRFASFCIIDLTEEFMVFSIIAFTFFVVLTTFQSCESFMSLTASRTDSLGGKGATLTPKSGTYDNVCAFVCMSSHTQFHPF